MVVALDSEVCQLSRRKEEKKTHALKLVHSLIDFVLLRDVTSADFSASAFLKDRAPFASGAFLPDTRMTGENGRADTGSSA